MDEDEQDEKHADEEQEGRGVEDPRRIRGQIQPMLLQRERSMITPPASQRMKYSSRSLRRRTISRI